MSEWARLGGNKIENKINFINAGKKIWMERLEAERNVYYELISNYNQFINEVSSLVKELSLPNNSISMSIVIEKLINLGVFSYNDDFIYENTKDQCLSKLGLQIVCGKGKCRHFSSFQKDIFNHLGLFNEEFYCEADYELKKDLITGEANHTANLIKYNNMYYVYDSFNSFLSGFVDSHITKVYGNEIYFYYKVELLMELYNLTKQDVIKRLSIFKLSSMKKGISNNEYDEISNESISSIIKNNKIISEFKADTIDIKEKILSKASKRRVYAQMD